MDRFFFDTAADAPHWAATLINSRRTTLPKRMQGPGPDAAQRVQAREKAFRSPLLMLAVVRLQDGDAAASITTAERYVSAGCAIQNMLLMATAQSYGSALTSGKALQSAPLRTLFCLGAEEEALCFVNIGTIASARPLRKRPQQDSYVTTLAPLPAGTP